jgi:hypothetical protein
METPKKTIVPFDMPLFATHVVPVKSTKRYPVVICLCIANNSPIYAGSNRYIIPTFF